MVQAVSGDLRSRARFLIKSNAGRPTRWRTDYIGRRAVGKVENHPQAFLIEMQANSTIGTHYHSVDQFQVLVAGSGTLGTHSAPLIALHYVDRHTPNGPTQAGPCGLSIFSVRTQCDPGAAHLTVDADYQERLKPSKQRYLVASGIELSTEPVLRHRSEVALENVLPQADGTDGLGASVLRLGGGMRTTGPDPRLTGGQFYLVLNGALIIDGTEYPMWSPVYLRSDVPPREVCAGEAGLEALVLSFSRPQ
jgi:hypothetical protein